MSIKFLKIKVLDEHGVYQCTLKMLESELILERVHHLSVHRLMGYKFWQ